MQVDHCFARRRRKCKKATETLFESYANAEKFPRMVSRVWNKGQKLLLYSMQYLITFVNIEGGDSTDHSKYNNDTSGCNCRPQEFLKCLQLWQIAWITSYGTNLELNITTQWTDLGANINGYVPL